MTAVTKLLIHPATLEKVAKLTEVDGKKKVEVLNKWLSKVIKANGITVPMGFIDHKLHIYEDDKPEYFAKAFTEKFFIHGLQQRGYYWVNEEDYRGPSAELEKTYASMPDALKKK